MFSSDPDPKLCAVPNVDDKSDSPPGFGEFNILLLYRNDKKFLEIEAGFLLNDYNSIVLRTDTIH